MPTSYVEKLAKKHGMSVDQAESKWNDAKKAAKEQDQGDNFAYVTQIFKSMMGETAQINSFVFKHRLLAADGVLVASGALILCSSTSRVLLALRSPEVDDPNLWCSVGGKVDFGETPYHAACREIHEEVGYAGPLVLEPVFVYKSPELRFHNHIGIVPKEFKPKLNWETTKADWFNLDRLPRPQHFGLKALLNDKPTVSKLKSLL